MTTQIDTSTPSHVRHRHGVSSTLIGTAAVIILGLCVAASILFAISVKGGTSFVPTSSTAHTQFPVGVPSSVEPSGYAPPGAQSLPGFSQSYVSDFKGSSLPAGWNVFTGIPAGDPGGQFGAQHVVVTNGLLELNTWRDPAYQNRWVTGGLCQCELGKTYGAYFVRSRITGPGPNEVELLWMKNNTWPPEIDFNETGGGVAGTSSTIHWSPINQIDQRHVAINMQRWHTWGLIWTPKTVTYLVDGQVWGVISSATEITRQPMTLDFEQRALCGVGLQCPTRPVSMLIDWVAEYNPK